MSICKRRPFQGVLYLASFVLSCCHIPFSGRLAGLFAKGPSLFFARPLTFYFYFVVFCLFTIHHKTNWFLSIFRDLFTVETSVIQIQLVKTLY